MLSKFILTVAIALHRAATKMRISAHVLAADVAKRARLKAAERADKTLLALEDMRRVYLSVCEACEQQASASAADRSQNFRAIELLDSTAALLENPEL